MNRRDFVRRRRADWDEFEDRLRRLERSRVARLRRDPAERFSHLFRMVCNDLAEVRSRGWSGELADYLNGLVARAHNAFYSAPPGRLSDLVRFLTTGYPRVFRENIGYFATGATLFVLPFVIAAIVVYRNPSLATRILPREQLTMMEAMYDHDPDQEDLEFDELRAGMAGFYVRNNVGIALRAYGTGILLGIPTIYVLLSNGIVIGSVFGYVVAAGHGRAFTSFVVSHGSFELTAIAVAGGAGLLLADAILHPGRRTVLESLKTKGLESVKIAAGAAAMLMVAALIEAFWSPAPVPSILKYFVGGALWVLVAAYLAFAGQGAEEGRT